MELFFTLLYIIAKIVFVTVPLLLAVAYYTYAERKIIGYIQLRIGPNRVGPLGLLQPIADAVKLIFKEIVIPSKSNKFLFIVAPVLSIAPSLAAWAVIPFGENFIISDINVGILYLLAMTSISVYGIIIAGWASNSKYALLGSLRSSAQMISYEISMSLCIVGVLMLSGSMNLKSIVISQSGGFFNWYFIPLFPLFLIYLISSIAETNRSPFDVAEGESEIVAGFHVEYSGMLFAVFFLAEYMNMILVSFLAVILFFGGWSSPFESIEFINNYLSWIPSVFWLFLKSSFFMFVFLWLRATFPRYRYDQIMRLGWKFLIPISLFWIIFVSFFVKFRIFF